MRALNMKGQYVVSCAIRGVKISHPSKDWELKHALIQAQLEQWEQDCPEDFIG